MASLLICLHEFKASLGSGMDGCTVVCQEMVPTHNLPENHRLCSLHFYLLVKLRHRDHFVKIFEGHW